MAEIRVRKVKSGRTGVVVREAKTGNRNWNAYIIRWDDTGELSVPVPKRSVELVTAT